MNTISKHSTLESAWTELDAAGWRCEHAGHWRHSKRLGFMREIRRPNPQGDFIILEHNLNADVKQAHPKGRW